MVPETQLDLKEKVLNMTRERLTTKVAAAKDNSRKVIEGRELEGFQYDKSKAKILKKVLHNLNVSLGTLISAMREISVIRGSEITPDGKLGGKGFIMSFKDIKQIINEAVGNLSDVTDTLSDELINPMWGLSPTEKKKVKAEKEEVDEEVEDAEEEISETGDNTSEDSMEDEPAEDESDDTTEDSPAVVEETVEEETVGENGRNDVGVPPSKESSDQENNRYRSLLASSNDKTSEALSRSIIANLLTGENKNG